MRTPGGVTIIGYTDLPSRLPTQSSTLYNNNIVKWVAGPGRGIQSGKDDRFQRWLDCMSPVRLTC